MSARDLVLAAVDTTGIDHPTFGPYRSRRADVALHSALVAIEQLESDARLLADALCAVSGCVTLDDRVLEAIERRRSR